VYPYSPRQRSPVLPVVLVAVVAVVVGLAAFQMLREPPRLLVTTTLTPATTVGAPTEVPLPASGSVIAAVEGLGTLAESNAGTARPIASVAKIMTAYLILKDHPLQPGQPGPTLTMSQADADRYLAAILEDQSALPLSAGQELSEYELLQGLLIASANNFAEVLAAWDAGSEAAFVAKMNTEAAALGLTGTTYADASGFSPATVSTAADQLVLARAAMADPVFAEIVAMREADLPGIGPIATTNQILGEGGVVGIKTGFTEEAGGNLAFAARQQLGTAQVDITGVVLGQPDRPASFTVSAELVARLRNGVGEASVIAAGAPVAFIDPPWAAPVGVVVAEEVRLLFWPGMTVSTTLEFDAVEAPLAAGDQVGWLSVQLGEQERRVPVVLAAPLAEPGLFWRLTRS
jgi:D-alanyl-D-alanine carboxypeptidase (penicillin-binding protein 5/6)